MAIETIGGDVVLPDGTKMPLSKAIRAGDFILVSGQLAFGTDGKIVQGGIAAQTWQCMENIKALLLSAGAGMEDIARTAIWLTDPNEFAQFNKVYSEFFPRTPPVRSAVCSALMLPEVRIPGTSAR